MMHKYKGATCTHNLHTFCNSPEHSSIGKNKKTYSDVEGRFSPCIAYILQKAADCFLLELGCYSFI